MRVLVTGCSGFIGPHLTSALQARGDHVVGIDRERPTAIEPDEFIQGDLLDRGALELALNKDIECIAHLAAARADWGVTDVGYVRDNVRATEGLIDSAKRANVGKWLVYSTVGVLGSSPMPLDDSAPLAPVGPYATSKAEAETLFARLAAADPDAQIVIIRPSAVYGPGNPPDTNVYRLIDAIHNQRFAMIGDGRVVKAISYLPNLVQATLFSMDRMMPGVQRYIYVDAPSSTTRELVGFIHDELGKTLPRWHIPLSLARRVAVGFDVVADLVNRDLPITSARIQKFCRPTNFARRSLDDAGFQQPVSNEDALRATVQWYVDTHVSA